jgi:tRNA G37 N-methylase TrmD
VLNLNLEGLMVAFEEGSIKNVGAADKSATAKLFDVEDVAVRAFGDRRVKLVADDGTGNEVQVALAPEQAAAVVDDVESLREEGPVFE